MTTMREEIIQWCERNHERLDDRLPVSECFGPTLQGEGSHMGRPCMFIRLGGCNLSCTWCDTPYSTGTHGIPLSTIPKTTIGEVVAKIRPGMVVVITGGEPLIHQNRPGWDTLLRNLYALGCEIHIETNGSILPVGDTAALVHHFTVSPKLDAPMLNKKHRPLLANWEGLAYKTIFKFVIDGDVEKQVQSAILTADYYGCRPDRVWVMPEGATAEALEGKWAEVAQAAADNNINASHRLHALAWGDAKGH